MFENCVTPPVPRRSQRYPQYTMLSYERGEIVISLIHRSKISSKEEEKATAHGTNRSRVPHNSALSENALQRLHYPAKFIALFGAHSTFTVRLKMVNYSGYG